MLLATALSLPRKFAPFRVSLIGAIAQLGERLLCKQEVVGSIPSASTTIIQVQRHPMHSASVRSLTSFIG